MFAKIDTLFLRYLPFQISDKLWNFIMSWWVLPFIPKFICWFLLNINLVGPDSWKEKKDPKTFLKNLWGFPIQDNEFPIKVFLVQNHWVTPSSSQPSMLPRSIKWASGFTGDSVGKSNCLHVVGLQPSGSWNLSMKRHHKPFLKGNKI